MAQERRNQEEKIDAKLHYVLDLWKRRIEWWNSDYSGGSWCPGFSILLSVCALNSSPEVLHFMEHVSMSKIPSSDWRHPMVWKVELEEKWMQEEDRKLKQKMEQDRIKEEEEKKRIAELLLEKET